jgi:hypothetical protein
MREDMMEKVGIPNSIQKSIMANYEPNEEGVYPDFEMLLFIGFKMGTP